SSGSSSRSESSLPRPFLLLSGLDSCWPRTQPVLSPSRSQQHHRNAAGYSARFDSVSSSSDDTSSQSVGIWVSSQSSSSPTRCYESVMRTVKPQRNLLSMERVLHDGVFDRKDIKKNMTACQLADPSVSCAHLSGTSMPRMSSRRL
ncbi:hypothetical protein CSPAE12_01233, partial [Colletotrichum incanum]